MPEIPAPFAPAASLPFADLVALPREPGSPIASEERVARLAAERRAERLGERLGALQRLSVALAAAGTAADVARALREHAAWPLEARTAVVATLHADARDAGGGALELLAEPAPGEPTPGAAAPGWPADEPDVLAWLARAARADRPLVAVEAPAPADAPDGAVAAAIARAGLRTLVALPLVAGGCAVGVLALGWAAPRRLDADERALAEAMAAQGALALARARLAGDERCAGTQLDALFEASPAGLAFFDRDLRYVRINAALAAMNRDRSAMEHLGRRPGEVDPGLAALEPLLRRVLDGGRALRGQELDALDTLGRAYRASYFPVPGPDGRAIGVGAIAEDVTTERVAALDREFLLDLSAELQLAADSDAVATAALTRLGARLALGRCALYELDPSARVAVGRCAWSAPDLPGGAAAPALPAAGFAALFDDALAGRVAVHADARTLAGDDGALPGDVRTLCVVPLLRQGRLAAALVATDRRARRWSSRERGLLRAVADRVWPAFETARLLEAEQRARAAAESASAAKSRFLATMSHELRTPLNAIAGYAELLALGLHGPVTDAQQEALARLRRSQRHLLALIDDVLQYAHLEAGRVSYRREPVSLPGVVREAAGLVAPVAQTRAIALDAAALDGVSDAEATVLVDGDKLRQVVRNLLSNALKFTAPGGRVAVTVAVEGGRVTLRVADTGVGIPSDRLADVFEPFVQVDAELTRTREGTGLGLAISRDLARGMGGELTVGSEVGRGSVFTLALPRG